MKPTGISTRAIACALGAAAAMLFMGPAPNALAAAAEPPVLPEDNRAAEQQPTQRVTPKPRVTPTSDRCETIYVNCILSDRQPRGSQCWCVTPFGPSYGKVR